LDTPADLNAIPAPDAVPPLAEPVRAPAISRSTLWVIVLATVVILVGLGVLGRVIATHHQVNSLYATPSAPLAIADAKDAAAKASAAARRAQLAADRAKAAVATKAAQP
jgi:hypothetical protein